MIVEDRRATVKRIARRELIHTHNAIRGDPAPNHTLSLQTSYSQRRLQRPAHCHSTRFVHIGEFLTSNSNAKLVHRAGLTLWELIPMDEEAAFLRAIHAAPHDPALRLVYADWLEERGDARAELLRVQCELVRMWSWQDERLDLAERLAELRQNFDPDWIAEVRSCTTPRPRIDVVGLFPELRSYARTAVRLHPRQGKAPQDASKMGGLFLWPKEEPWPHCERDRVPFTPVLQIRREDVASLPFPGGTDLLQVIWCAMGHEDLGWSYESRLIWRRREDVKHPIEWIPPVPGERDYWRPNLRPCRLYPEPVLDFPRLRSVLPRSKFEEIQKSGEMRAAIDAYAAVADGYDLDELQEPSAFLDLFEICGTKVGGFGMDYGANSHAEFPTCSCGRPMELLIQVGTEESFSRDEREMAIEDRRQAQAQLREAETPSARFHAENSLFAPSGFMIHDAGAMHIFVCPKCPSLPTAVSSSG